MKKKEREKLEKERIEIEKQKKIEFEKAEKERKEKYLHPETGNKIKETKLIIMTTTSNIPIGSNMNIKNINISNTKEIKTEPKFVRHQPSKTMDKTTNSVLSKYKNNEIAKNNFNNLNNNIKESKYISPSPKHEEIKTKYTTTYKTYKKEIQENNEKININKVNTNIFEKNIINKNVVNIQEKEDKKVSNIAYTKFKQPEIKKETIEIENTLITIKTIERPLEIKKDKKIKEINIPKEISNKSYYITQTEISKTKEQQQKMNEIKKPEVAIKTQYISSSPKNISHQISKSMVNLTESSYKPKPKMKNVLPLVNKGNNINITTTKQIKSKYFNKEKDKESELIDFELKMARERANKEMEKNERIEQYKIIKEKKIYEEKIEKENELRKKEKEKLELIEKEKKEKERKERERLELIEKEKRERIERERREKIEREKEIERQRKLEKEKKEREKREQLEILKEKE